MSLIVIWQGRRKSVKLTPNTSMQNVLEMACKEYGIEQVANYGLQHKKNLIDLSQPFRFTGIANNANIDLVEQRSQVGQKVRIALQATGGERLTESFDPDITLAGIISHWVGVGRLDRIYAEQEVVIVYLRQGFEGRQTVEATSLRAMGLNSGSAVLNLRLGSEGGGPASGTSSSNFTSGRSTMPPLCSSSSSSTTTRVGGGGGGGVEETKSSGSNPPPSSSSLAAWPTGPPPVPTATSTASSSLPPTSTPMETFLPPAPAPAPMEVSRSQDSISSTISNASSSSAAAIAPSSLPQPAIGLEAAKAAIDELSANNFDSDVKESVALLAKYIDNIVGKPNDPKTRSVRCSNVHFQSKIANRQGALGFLVALGFQEEQKGLTHEIISDPAAHTFMTLVPEREDKGKLLRARRFLQEIAREVDLDIGMAPDPSRLSALAQAPPPTFDPYRPSFVSMTGTMPREKGPSITEIKLAELKSKQEVIQAQTPPRSIQVIPPFSSEAGAGGGARESRGPSSSAGGVCASSSSSNATISTMMDDESTAGDMTALARSVAAKFAQKKREEEAPFRTKAQRELESLEKAKVYAHTVLRVQLPDRTIIMARFHPRETIGDVRKLLVEEVFSEEGQSKMFTLYASPPRRVFEDTCVLQEEGMVPAAVFYLSWDEEEGIVPAAVVCLRWDEIKGSVPSTPFIRPEFLTDGVSAGGGGSSSKMDDNSSTTAAALYPVGVDLVAKPVSSSASSSASASEGGLLGSRGGSSGSRSGGGGGAGKKPAWMKL